MRLACQTITYGDGQHEILDEMLAEISTVGYEGVEIGFQRLASIGEDVLHDALKRHGLCLVASHTGGNVEEPTDLTEGRPAIDVILDRLELTATAILNYSGRRYEDAARFERDLGILNRVAERCADRGIRLCYHNHWWEIENDGFVIRQLLAHGSSHLGFCPDVGWIVRGGMDALEVLEMMGDRVGAVHFKDIDSVTSDPVRFVEFGRGIVPLEKTADWQQANLPQTWAIAEQDRSELSPGEATAQNAAFLRRCFR